MAELTDADIAMLTTKNVGHLATINEDGSPHVAPVWVDAAPGGEFVLVNSAAGRVKDRNIVRDPRVALSVHDQDDTDIWISVRGVVQERVTGDQAESHIDALSRRYYDEPWEYVPGSQRVLYRIKPERVSRGQV